MKEYDHDQDTYRINGVTDFARCDRNTHSSYEACLAFAPRASNFSLYLFSRLNILSLVYIICIYIYSFIKMIKC